VSANTRFIIGYLVGVALAAVGVAGYSVPAGLIAAGIAVVVLSVLQMEVKA
jgi:hypothetical protein